MLETLDKHEMPCTCALNVAVLQHFPEICEAMVARNWNFMSHGIYNALPVEAPERKSVPSTRTW